MKKRPLNYLKFIAFIFPVLILYLFIAIIFKKTGENKTSKFSPVLSSNIGVGFVKNDNLQPEVYITSVEKGKSNVSTTMKMEGVAKENVEKDDQIVFSGVQPNTDAVYKKIENGVKEDIVLHQKPESQPLYNFFIETEGMTIQMFENQYYFFDEQGFARFTIPKPFMIDAEGQRSEDVQISIDKTDSGYQSTVKPSMSWLTSTERKYPVTIDPSLVVPEKAIREVHERRTTSTKTYDLGDGKFAAVGGLEVLHYKDKNGSWKEVDTTIVPSDDPDYNYMNVTNNFQTYFSSDGFENKKSVKYAVGDSYMKFNFTGGKGKGSKDSAKSNVFSFSEVYKEGENTMDANYTLSKDKLLEEVVLNKFQGYPNLKQEIELHNVYFKQEGSEIFAYRNDTNELLWIIPRPVMYEANNPGIRNYGLHYEIQKKSDNTIVLEKVMDQEGKDWLSSQDRNYPIIIDITAGPNTNTYSCSFTVAVGGGIDWQYNATGDLASIDDDYYFANLPTWGSYTHYLGACNFGFSIPNNGIVNGVMAEAWQGDDIYGVARVNAHGEAKLRTTSGLVGNIRYCSPFAQAYCSMGGSIDTWGATLTYSDVNSEDFGFAEKAHFDNDDEGGTEVANPYIDQMRITVYYTPVGEDLLYLKGLKIKGVNIR